MKTSSFDIHQDITNRIVAAIEAGAGEFQMPWHQAGSTAWPVNAKTNRQYRGVNVLVLWVTALNSAYPTSEWATFKQWQERGAQVRKGEKGTPVVFYKDFSLTSDDGSEERHIPFARASWVFNAAQVDGYAIENVASAPMSEFERLDNVEVAVSATKARIDFGGAQAFYHRSEDRIQIPNAEDFTGSVTSSAQESFYSTNLHELTHWSGATHRLDRVKGKKFADRAYCFEELIAELGAAFLCGRLGITTSPRLDHAQYISQYLEVLKNDKKAIFAAASAAAAATDYILGFSRALEREDAA